jgi:hypothetical protein
MGNCTMHRCAIVVLVACLIALAVAPPVSARTSSTAAPKSVALRLTDLPAGFKLFKAHSVSNADMALKTRLKKKNFDMHGRITGFEEDFDRATASSGQINVSAYVYAYRSSAGAHWDYLQTLKLDLKHAKQASAPSVGNERTGMVIHVKSGKRSLTFYLIVFHRNQVDATIAVGGFTGDVSMTDAGKYAALVDTRIQSGR